MRRLLVWVEVLRPHNMLAAAFGVAAGYYIAGGRDLSVALLAASLTGFITGSGNIINDYFDADIDRVNKPRRPLPSGRLTPGAALKLYVVLSAVLGPVALVLMPLGVAMLMVAWQLVLWVYAARLKRTFLLGNLLITATASSPFVAGAMRAGDTAAGVLPFAIAFLFVLSRELVKGAEDIEGDRAAGVRTVAVVVGLDKATLSAAGLMLALAVLLPLPALMQVYARTYFWLMEGLVVPGLLLGAYLILARPQRRSFTQVSWILKAEMFCGILAVGLGRG